jgi:ubiquitin-like protein Pup
MADQVQKRGSESRGTTETTETVDAPAVSEETAAKAQEVKDGIDEILDKLDEVLEENAQEFVASYVQKGGQ